MLRVKLTDPKNELKIFSANVLQENQQYGAMLQQIKSADADLVFLLETNAEWHQATSELKNEYPPYFIVTIGKYLWAFIL